MRLRPGIANLPKGERESGARDGEACAGERESAER
jgi:hypothetical protein